MHKVIWISAITHLTLLGIIPVATAGDVEIDRVKAEWPAVARRLDEMFAQVRGEARLWYDDPHASAKSFLTVAHFAIDHGMEKVELSRFTQGSKPVKLADIVYCVGEDTAFQLYRRAGAEKYDVKGIGTTRTDRDRYISLFGRFVLAHHGVLGRPMTRVLDSPGFEITGAEAFDKAGKNLIRIDCEFGSSATKERISLVLDLGAVWIVRSCRWRPSFDPNSLFNFEVEYGPSRDGVPLPRYVTITDEPGGVVEHCEFTDWTFAETPVSEFNMTYYGLPDLVHARRPRNPLPYWLAGFAVLFGLIAFVIRWFASRGSAPARRDAVPTATQRL